MSGWSQRETGGTSCLGGSLQASMGGTSRMNREIHVRICGRLGVQFPGPTRRLSWKETQEATKTEGLVSNLTTPDSVQKLQTALHDKAKESPNFRFYALYDKVYRKDVLAFAYECCQANGGAAGVDGQTFFGAGVLGSANATTGPAFVFGQSNSPNGNAIFGNAASNSGFPTAVVGFLDSQQG